MLAGHPAVAPPRLYAKPVRHQRCFSLVAAVAMSGFGARRPAANAGLTELVHGHPAEMVRAAQPTPDAFESSASTELDCPWVLQSDPAAHGVKAEPRAAETTMSASAGRVWHLAGGSSTKGVTNILEALKKTAGKAIKENEN
jgi:hypothetical protein